MKSFPKSYRLMADLADSLSSIKSGTNEVIQLCQKVISECTDNEIRDLAFQTIIFKYKNIDQKEKAVEYAKMMSHVWVSQEDMMISIFGNEADIADLREYISFCADRLMTCLDILATKKCYSSADKLILLKQVVGIADTVFCDGDYNFYAHHVICAYQTMAEDYSIKADKNNTLSALEKMSKASIIFDTYADDVLNTSPAVRGDRHGRPIPWHDGNSSSRLLKCLHEEKWYDFIRSEPRFQSVMETLEKYAE